MTEHIIHRIILTLLLKASKNVDFMAVYIASHRYKMSEKNPDFMTEHMIHRIILSLKASKNADFTAEHVKSAFLHAFCD